MLGLFGPKSGKIGVYKAAFIYQGPLKEDFSAGSPAINEVVLEVEFSEVHIHHAEYPSLRAGAVRHLATPMDRMLPQHVVGLDKDSLS
jgi:hypothetical protein